MKKSPWFRAICIWAVPFFISMFMVDPVTKAYLPNIIIFKIVMFISAISMVYWSSRYLTSNRGHTALIVLLVNTILDMIVLVGIFQMPFISRLATILPLYVIGFGGGYYLWRK